MRDTEVVASIVAGDPKGLAAAYDRYADPLHTYCRSVLRDPADAADAVQDTFVIAASRLDGLRDPEKLRSWLYAVARNECLRILRSAKDTSGLDEAPDVTDTSADVSADAERAELRTLFLAAANGLNPHEREVIELSMQHELDPGEIAETLGVSRNHAHSLLSRARDQLEACLGALLVGRAGRDECKELGSLLTNWDGQLTVLLRKRLHRHIEHCSTCTKRRAFELRPAAFFGTPPMVALAGAVAGWWRWVLPTGLGAKVLALATGTDAAAVAHRAAAANHAGHFGHQGFPKPLHVVKAGAAHGPAGKAGAFLKTPQGQGTAAAVIIAIAAASTAMALTGNSGPADVSSSRPGHSSGSGSGGGAGAGGGAGGGGGGSGASGSHKGHGGKGSPSSKSGPGSRPGSAGHSSPSGSNPATGGSGLTVPGLNSPALPSGPPSLSSPGSPGSSSPSPEPTTNAGLTASPAGGILTLPTTITLTNNNGAAVNWSLAVSGGSGTVSVAPAKGTLKPGKSVTVSVKATSQFAAGQTITLTPGATSWIVVMGFGSSTITGSGLPTTLP